MDNTSPSSARRLPSIVSLTVHVYQWLLAICPSQLRRVYGSQMAQVFKQCCRDAYATRGVFGVAQLWLPTLSDLLVGAAAEYITILIRAWKESWLMHRIRSSEITVFCAYIAFILAGMGFQKLTEYDDFMAAARAHSTIGLAYNVIVGGAALALLAVLAGGLPLALAAMRYALATGRKDIPLLFGVPVLAFLLLIGYIIAGTHQVFGASSTPQSAANTRLLGGLLIILFGGAIASAAAVSLAIARSEISPALYRFSRVPAAIAAVAMAAMLVATVIWGVSLRASVPQLFNSNEGIKASSTAASWAVIVVMMALATIVALVGVVRGFTTRQLASATA